MHNMNPIAIRGELSFSGRVSSSCSICGICRVTFVKSGDSHEKGKEDGIVTTPNGICVRGHQYSETFNQIFCIGDFNLTTRDPWFRNAHVSNTLTLTTSSEILYHLRNVNSISRCC
jgi:hypothetical protein